MSDISVSEERLRLILAEFKLELFERLSRDLAAKADVSQVEALKTELRDHGRLIGDAQAIIAGLPELQRDVKGLKAAASEAHAVSRYKKAVYAGIVAAIGAVGGAIGYAVSLI